MKNYHTTLIFILSYVSLSSSSSDPLFNTCFSAECGDVSITYPFYITNQQKSWCGYPGFEISCKNGSLPYLSLSNTDYVIKNIWYENQTLEILNTAFDSSIQLTDNCSNSIQNLTLGTGSFEFATGFGDLILLFSCPENVLEEHKGNLVNCGGLAVREDDPELEGLKGKCKGKVVSVPYGGEREGFREGLSKGVLLSWVANDCSDCRASGGQCGFNRNISLFQCYCSDRPRSRECHRLDEREVEDELKRGLDEREVEDELKREKPKLKLILAIVAGRSKSLIVGSAASGLGIILLVLLALVIYSRRKSSINMFTFLSTRGTEQNHNVEAFLKSYGSLAPKRYTYTDIKKMTNSFNDRIGEGGYGHVYKGKLNDGRFVAVKVLKKLKGNGEEFINEVLSIVRTNHVNVVTLLGFCFERNKQALIYEFMANGSLEKYIQGKASGQPLPNETLLNVVVGIARGLDYLHRGCNTRILHFDIKPHNILLDEKFCPKISDFGLARLFPKEQSHISTLEARGTIGYIAPEVFCRNFGGVSHKSDVYSFGMMVIDMVCGRKNAIPAEVESSSALYFPQWIYNQLQVEEESELHMIMSDEETKLQRKMILVGLWCIQTYPSNRPSMNEALEMLEGSLESLQIPPKPDLSSPSRSVAFDSSSTTQLTP